MFTTHPNERTDRPRNTTAKKLNNLAWRPWGIVCPLVILLETHNG